MFLFILIGNGSPVMEEVKDKKKKEIQVTQLTFYYSLQRIQVLINQEV